MNNIILVIILLSFSLQSCNKEKEKQCNFFNLSELVSNAQSFEYQHIIFSDNRFNFSQTYDTTYVNYFKLDNDNLGFHILKKEYEWLLDNGNLIELNHKDRTRSIESIPNYKSPKIDDFSILRNNILSVLDTVKNADCEELTIDGVDANYFYKSHSTSSHIDSTQIVKYQYAYSIPRNSFNYLKLKETIIRDGDTLQIRWHKFDGINISDKIDVRSKYNRFYDSNYDGLNQNESQPFVLSPIKEGDKIISSTYVDVEGVNYDILDKDKDYSVVLFSFIGCTPCELALQDLKIDSLNLLEKSNFYYSSHQDNSQSVKKYLATKNLNIHGFGKESEMIYDFNLVDSPTFVVINSKGYVQRIIEGYDKSVLKEIYDIIQGPS